MESIFSSRKAHLCVVTWSCRVCGHCFCIPNNRDDFILLIKPSDESYCSWNTLDSNETEIGFFFFFFFFFFFSVFYLMFAVSNVADYTQPWAVFKARQGARGTLQRRMKSGVVCWCDMFTANKHLCQTLKYRFRNWSVSKRQSLVLQYVRSGKRDQITFFSPDDKYKTDSLHPFILYKCHWSLFLWFRQYCFGQLPIAFSVC